MRAMASQITSLTMVYLTVYSGADQSKTSKLHVTALCAGNSSVTSESPHKGQVPRKMFPFDDVIIIDLWSKNSSTRTDFRRKTLQEECPSDGMPVYNDIINNCNERDRYH